MPLTVKCGEKGRHLEIPKGYRRLAPDQLTEKGDKGANIIKLYWMYLGDDEIGWRAEVAGDHIIRKINTL